MVVGAWPTGEDGLGRVRVVGTTCGELGVVSGIAVGGALALEAVAAAVGIMADALGFLGEAL